MDVQQSVGESLLGPFRAWIGLLCGYMEGEDADNNSGEEVVQHVRLAHEESVHLSHERGRFPTVDSARIGCQRFKSEFFSVSSRISLHEWVKSMRRARSTRVKAVSQGCEPANCLEDEIVRRDYKREAARTPWHLAT